MSALMDHYDIAEKCPVGQALRRPSLLAVSSGDVCGAGAAQEQP